MVRIPSPVARWSRSTRARHQAHSNAGGVRVLSHEDTAAVRRLIDADPVAHAFVEGQIDATGTVAPHAGTRFLGRFDGPDLVSACWVGANVVPVTHEGREGAVYGEALLQLRQRFASVFGPSEAVLGLWDRLSTGRQRAFDVRERQPLMTLRGRPLLRAAESVRRAYGTDYERLLPACAAMFEEELGYSPLAHGEAAYRERVRYLIDAGHAYVETDGRGEILFKAELGVVTERVTQVQGVWMAPERRGQGLAASRMADVALAAQDFAPVVSLYVNDYNAKALATYERVGFRHVGEFATVLF